jgi:hypothetical protein
LSVDVDGEQYNVEQQTGNAQGRYQLLVSLKGVDEICETKKAEFPVIVSKETQYGNEQAYEDAKNKVVFFQERHV